MANRTYSYISESRDVFYSSVTSSLSPRVAIHADSGNSHLVGHSVDSDFPRNRTASLSSTVCPLAFNDHPGGG